jgi:hypothetical protein
MPDISRALSTPGFKQMVVSILGTMQMGGGRKETSLHTQIALPTKKTENRTA